MSGICGILHHDGRPAAPGDVALMLGRLAARGPDRADMAIDGPVGLGHALLATTPEAQVEPMPLVHPESGCRITADVRLDNRAELIAALRIDDRGRVVGDGELILEAYLRWGPECPARLEGDFAFAIWDPRHQRLLCARDKVGMRQLIYWHGPGKLFAFATDVDALRAAPGVPSRINEARIADFLDDLEAYDLTSTFYLDLQRLPPAHTLLVERGALRIARYWQLVPPSPLRCASDAAYAEAFLAVFDEAVRARLRAPAPVGAMLSGGMDSGSVCAVAGRLLKAAGAPPLRTYSAIDDDPECPESRAIRAALAMPHIDPQVISPAGQDSYIDDLVRLTRDSSEPFDAPMAVIRAIYLAARRHGLKVVLDGVGGDTTLPMGNLVAHHLAAGRPFRAWHEARAYERFSDGAIGGREAYWKAARRLLVPEPLKTRRLEAWLNGDYALEFADSIVHPDLAARLDVPARRRAHFRHVAVDPGCAPTLQVKRMLHPYVTVGRERYDRVAGAMGIEPRDPFLDTRVLALCLSLPVAQIQADGWPKLILRRAMRGVLPDAVIWKTGRHHVGPRYIGLLDARLDDNAEEDSAADLQRYVQLPDPDRVADMPRDGDAFFFVTRAKYLELWLSRAAAQVGTAGFAAS